MRRSRPAADLAEELVSQRAASRVGELVQILVEEVTPEVTGRAAHQGPEVDGSVRLRDAGRHRVGQLVDAMVVDSEGADLVAETVASW
jgi:ribosomal protein S12 methylthiotransferase